MSEGSRPLEGPGDGEVEGPRPSIHESAVTFHATFAAGGRWGAEGDLVMNRAANIYLGFGLIGLGVFLTVLTHNTGQPVIFYGLILVGGYRVIRGLMGA